MGQFSSQKDEEIENEEGENEYLQFSSSNIKGWKKRNDNKFLSKLSQGEQNNLDIFCIFDGNNGNEISTLVKNHFSEELLNNINKSNSIKEAINNTFLRMNELIKEDKSKEEIIKLKISNLKEENQKYKKILEEKEPESEIELTSEEKEEIWGYTGCTGCLILIDEKNKKLFFGNIGNSEAIIYGKNKPEIFSSKHRPKDEFKEKEKDLIINDKLFGVLNVCRTFGNFAYIGNEERKILSDNPDILEYNIKDEDEFIFIGTESIIECIDKIKFGDIIKNKINEEGETLTETLDVILKDNIEYDFYNNDTEFGFDNITCTLIKIKTNEKNE